MTTITAKIIADSRNPNGKRITTMQLRYPRPIHSEFMTHRAFSRNASSSRAIPVERLIQDVLDDPFVPLSWGKNQKGMQAGEEHDASVRWTINKPKKKWWKFWRNSTTLEFSYSREEGWKIARDVMVIIARAFSAAGYHKQIVNRLLEPFSHINVVVTATEWGNFFHLRDHPDAEPHIQILAQKMYTALTGSTTVTLQAGEWHLPYVDEDGEIEDLIKISVARCARVSYLTHDGRKTTVKEDLDLYDRLVAAEPLHASPTEHQAQADHVETNGQYLNSGYHGNFIGWVQFRKTLKGENYAKDF